MLTVGKDAAGVERLLSAGRLGCPGCGQAAGRVGHARPRVVRGAGGIGGSCGRGGRGARAAGARMCYCRSACWRGGRMRSR